MNEKEKNIDVDLFWTHFSRRDFIRYSTMTMTVAALPAISTCATSYPKKDCMLDIAKKENTGSGKQVFEEVFLGKIKVKNRIVRSAATLLSADEFGRPTRVLLDQYTEMAEGGVGTIITGMEDSGLLIDDMKFKDADLNEYRKVPNRVHKYNTAIIQQIAHQGSQAGFGSDGGKFSLNRLNESEIEDIINKFVLATERSKNADFDGIQLHGAHGYLLSEFLSPDMNRRTDKWGGSTENRFRVVREIIQRIRKKTGDFPVLMKINAYDFRRKGMKQEEAEKIAILLEDAGCNAIEVSCGTAKEGFSIGRVPEIPIEAILEFTPYGDIVPGFMKKAMPIFSPLITPFFVKRYEPLNNYNVCAARKIKQKVDIPVIVVGGIREFSDIKQILNENAADFIAMARPFIIEPGIVNSFKNGDQSSSGCISCGYCVISVVGRRPAKCFYGELA